MADVISLPLVLEDLWRFLGSVAPKDWNQGVVWIATGSAVLSFNDIRKEYVKSDSWVSLASVPLAAIQGALIGAVAGFIVFGTVWLVRWLPGAPAQGIIAGVMVALLAIVGATFGLGAAARRVILRPKRRAEAEAARLAFEAAGSSESTEGPPTDELNRQLAILGKALATPARVTWARSRPEWLKKIVLLGGSAEQAWITNVQGKTNKPDWTSVLRRVRRAAESSRP